MADLRRTIREALSQSSMADPHDIAGELLPTLAADEIAEAAEFGLNELVREEVRGSRKAERQARPVGPSRWKVAAKERERLEVMGEWKFKDECTVQDLIWLAETYAQESEALRTQARETRQLANELRKSGCATLGEMWRRSGRKAAA